MSKLEFDVQEWPRTGTPYAEVSEPHELAALMMSRAQNQLKRMGTQKTAMLFLTEDKVYMAITPLTEKENERVGTANLGIRMAHDLSAFAVGMVSECWLIPGVTEVKGEPSKLLHHENKVEMLLVSVNWEGKEAGAKALEIVRDGGGGVSFRRRDDLITSEGVDGVFVLKQKQKSLAAEVLNLPIPV